MREEQLIDLESFDLKDLHTVSFGAIASSVRACIEASPRIAKRFLAELEKRVRAYCRACMHPDLFEVAGQQIADDVVDAVVSAVIMEISRHEDTFFWFAVKRELLDRQRSVRRRLAFV